MSKYSSAITGVLATLFVVIMTWETSDCPHNTVLQISTKVFNNICECEREYTKSSCRAAEREALQEVKSEIREPHK